MSTDTKAKGNGGDAVGPREGVTSLKGAGAQPQSHYSPPARRENEENRPDTGAAAVWADPRSLSEWARNPRVITDRAVQEVAASITRHGWGAPIVARTDGRVIAGHTRLRAALHLGLDSVPVRYLDVDDDTADALALADNKLSELASWDWPALEDVLRGLDDRGVDMAGIGWSQTELDALLDPINPATDVKWKVVGEGTAGGIPAAQAPASPTAQVAPAATLTTVSPAPADGGGPGEPATAPTVLVETLKTVVCPHCGGEVRL